MRFGDVNLHQANEVYFRVEIQIFEVTSCDIRSTSRERKPHHDPEKSAIRTIARAPTMTSRYTLALIAVLITAPSVAASGNTIGTFCDDGFNCDDVVCDNVLTVRRNPVPCRCHFFSLTHGRIVVRPVV